MFERVLNMPLDLYIDQVKLTKVKVIRESIELLGIFILLTLVNGKISKLFSIKLILYRYAFKDELFDVRK